jgi:hypothetical protein
MQEHAILKRKIDWVEEDVEALKADFRRARGEIAALQVAKKSSLKEFWDRHGGDIGLMLWAIIVSMCALPTSGARSRSSASVVKLSRNSGACWIASSSTPTTVCTISGCILPLLISDV